MKPFCKSLVLGLIVSVMTLLPLSNAYAQSPPEPAIVISIAKFEEQMNDVNYLLTASGFANMKFMASAMIKGYTKGLDGKKPAGVLLYFSEDSEEPDFLGLIPVSNLDDVLDLISNTGQAEIEDGDEFTTIIAPDGTEVFVKETDGYAFFSSKQEMLESSPAASLELIGKTAATYNLAAQVFAQRIPMQLRDNILQMIRESSEDTFDNLGADDLASELQRKNFQMQMKQMEMMFEQTDQLTVGMSADEDAKRLYMDIIFTGLPGSDLAKKLADSKPSEPTQFSGFLMDGAAFTQNGSSTFNEEDAQEMSKMMDGVQEAVISELDQDGDLSEADLATVEKLVDGLIEVAKETLEAGALDTGAVVMLEEGDVNFAFGAQVADPTKVEALVKEIAALIDEKLDGEVETNLNSGSHKDVTFHEFVIPIPDDQNEARDIIGDEVTVVVGIGENAVYLAGGSDPVALLKRAMDGKKSVEEMGQFNIYLTPILKFATSVDDNPASEAMADAMAESGSDRIRMTSNLIENGLHMQFEMQDGILGLIKVGFDAFNNMGGQGFPGGEDDF